MKKRNWESFYSFLISNPSRIVLGGELPDATDPESELFYAFMGANNIPYSDAPYFDITLNDDAEMDMKYRNSLFLIGSKSRRPSRNDVKILTPEDCVGQSSLYSLSGYAVEKDAIVDWGKIVDSCIKDRAMNAIIIIDPYIDNYPSKNIVPFIERLVPESLQMNLVISIISKVDNTLSEADQERIRKIKPGMITLECFKDWHGRFHDRVVITNYNTIEVGGGFDIVGYDDTSSKLTKFVSSYVDIMDLRGGNWNDKDIENIIFSVCQLDDIRMLNDDEILNPILRNYRSSITYRQHTLRSHCIYKAEQKNNGNVYSNVNYTLSIIDNDIYAEIPSSPKKSNVEQIMFKIAEICPDGHFICEPYAYKKDGSRKPNPFLGTFCQIENSTYQLGGPELEYMTDSFGRICHISAKLPLHCIPFKNRDQNTQNDARRRWRFFDEKKSIQNEPIGFIITQDLNAPEIGINALPLTQDTQDRISEVMLKIKEEIKLGETKVDVYIEYDKTNRIPTKLEYITSSHSETVYNI